MSMSTDEQISLKWNRHQNNLVTAFHSLFESETFVDCTLAAEGRYLRAHKVILSACSPYFAMLLRDHPDKFPILILKDVKYKKLESLMKFVYRGEVNIARQNLDSFLELAESLQITGLRKQQSPSRSTSVENPAESSPVVTETGHHSEATTLASPSTSPRMDITRMGPTMCNEVPPIVNNTPNVVATAVLTDGLIKSESVKNELFHETVTIEDSNDDPNGTSHSPKTCLPLHNNRSGSNNPVSDNDHEMNFESEQLEWLDANGEPVNLDDHLSNGPPSPFIAGFANQPLKNLNEIESPKCTKTTRSKTYRCSAPGCGASFKKAKERKYHEQNFHDNPIYRCSKCGKTFKNQGNLASHMASHINRSVFPKKKQRWCNKKTRKTPSKLIE